MCKNEWPFRLIGLKLAGNIAHCKAPALPPEGAAGGAAAQQSGLPLI